MRKYKIVIPCVIVLLIAAGLFVNHLHNKKLEVTFYQVSTTKNIDDLRIIELSDLHLKEFGPNNDTLVAKVESLRPDIIAIVGDMTMWSNPDHSVALSLVKRLSNLAPVYYSAGNHEYEDILRNENTTLIADIENAGGIYLDNNYKEAKIGTNKLLIGAICKNESDVLQYTSTTSMLEEFSSKKDFTLLLSHYPEVFRANMDAYPVDLALCGHAHGGMIRLPFTDGLYAPDQGLFPKLTSGMRELCGSAVIISRGLGQSHSYELRVNNRPEIVVVDIN